MSAEALLAVGGAIIIFITLAVVVFKKVPKRVKKPIYLKKWREIQRLCANKEDWSHAVIHADMLLDEVLRKKKVQGKTMGERMVNVQDNFSTHDAVWDAHKLANNLRQEGTQTLSESDVKATLIAFRQALRDMGAL